MNLSLSCMSRKKQLQQFAQFHSDYVCLCVCRVSHRMTEDWSYIRLLEILPYFTVLILPHSHKHLLASPRLRLFLCPCVCVSAALAFFFSSMFYKKRPKTHILDFPPAIHFSSQQVSRVWRRLIVNDVAYWNDRNQRGTEWHRLLQNNGMSKPALDRRGCTTVTAFAGGT